MLRILSYMKTILLYLFMVCRITMMLWDYFRKLAIFMSDYRYAQFTEETEQSESFETSQELNEDCFQFDIPVKIQQSHGSENFAGTKTKSKRYFSLVDYVNKSFKWNLNRKESKEKLQRTENKRPTERIVRFDVPQTTKCKRRADNPQRQSTNEKLLFSDIPTTADQEIFDLSKRQFIIKRPFCHDHDGEAQRLRKAAFARLHAEQERARREAFVSILIAKLNQVKRDQEVRECLGDCLRDFRPYSPHRGQVRACGFRFAGNQLKKVFRKRKKNRRVYQLQESRKSTSSEPQLLEKNYQIQYSNPAYTTVGYCFGTDTIPFLTRIEGARITLMQFKNVFRRRGNYRYFFKKHSSEFGTEIVFEEITEDHEILPLWEGKIFAKVEEI